MFFTVGQPCCIHICLCYCCDDIYCYDDNLTDNDDSENNNGHRIDCSNSKKRKNIYIAKWKRPQVSPGNWYYIHWMK